MNDSILNEIMAGGKPSGKRAGETQFAAPPEGDDFDITKMEGCYSKLAAIHNLVCLHVGLADGSVETLQYHHADVKGKYEGGKFVIEFAGTKLWELRVWGSGPDMWMVYDRICRHRMRAIKAALPSEAKFAKGETLLTKIEIADVTPKEHTANKDDDDKDREAKVKPVR